MNQPLLIFLLFASALALLARWWPQYLFLIWPVLLLVGQTNRTLIGDAPFYWYDVASLALLARVYFSADLRQWPRTVPRWHRWFLAVSLLFGLLAPLVRYGPQKQLLWIVAHTSLAWMAFPIGLALHCAPAGAAYRRQLANGLLIALLITAAIALLQFGSPQRAVAVNHFFNRDLKGSLLLDETFASQYNSSRVNGPWGGPNEFGGTTAIATCLFLLVRGRRARWLMYVALACAAAIVATTVSRQVLVAVALGVIVAACSGSFRGKAQLLVAAALVLGAGLATGAYENWTHRLAKWQGGIGQDLNITGRLVIGPQRMLALIDQDPSVLLVGVGLDVQKLAKKTGRDVDADGLYRSGMASNSFLLPLYSLGMSGFLLMASFWTWVLFKAKALQGNARSLALGTVVVAILLIASDNYAFMFETTLALLFLLGSAVAGRWSSVELGRPAAPAPPAASAWSLLT